jgi:hypothetical protein
MRQPILLPFDGCTCKLGDEPPAAMAVGQEEDDQLLVLLRGPRPLLEADLLAARLPAHLSFTSSPWTTQNEREMTSRLVDFVRLCSWLGLLRGGEGTSYGLENRAGAEEQRPTEPQRSGINTRSGKHTWQEAGAYVGARP